MNSLLKCVKNRLVVINSIDYLQELYKLCLQQVKEGSLVVLLTSEYYDFSKLLSELNVNKEELKNLILMYFKNIDDVSQKLLLQHNWPLLPFLVAVDLSQLLLIELETCTSEVVMQKVTLCTVSLLTYLQSIAFKMPGTVKIVNGLLILRQGLKNFGHIEVQTLKDLYFYQTDTLCSFDSVGDAVQRTDE